MIPVIETERLRLRGHTMADFEASAAMWGDPGVARFISGKPSTREESWRRMMTYPGHWALLGFGFWLIEEKATGAFVGEAGFADFKRNIEAKYTNGAPEQGWALSPDMHGRGYAYEATAAQIAWGEQHFGRSDFFCMIAPENAPSLRVAEKLGYQQYGRTQYMGSDSFLLRRPA